MLQNAYLLAKNGADTAENEQTFANILPKIGKKPTLAAGPRGAERDGRHQKTNHFELDEFAYLILFANCAEGSAGGVPAQGLPAPRR